MTTGYKINDQQGYYFLTFTIVQWADIFSREVYRDIVLDSFNFCIVHKGLRVHAWVIMTNHLHCILSTTKGNLSGIIRDMKSFTAKQIIDQVSRGPESRKDWLLLMSRYAAGGHMRNEQYQVWAHDNHAEELYSPVFIMQKMNYIHLNPVRAGWVHEPQHWIYSSAADYYYERQIGKINISLLDMK